MGLWGQNLVGTGGVRGFNKTAGCAAPENTRVQLIGPGGEKKQFVYPCFEDQTLGDLLRDPLTWRYMTTPSRSCRDGVGRI